MHRLFIDVENQKKVKGKRDGMDKGPRDEHRLEESMVTDFKKICPMGTTCI